MLLITVCPQFHYKLVNNLNEKPKHHFWDFISNILLVYNNESSKPVSIFSFLSPRISLKTFEPSNISTSPQILNWWGSDIFSDSEIFRKTVRKNVAVGRLSMIFSNIRASGSQKEIYIGRGYFNRASMKTVVDLLLEKTVVTFV